LEHVVHNFIAHSEKGYDDAFSVWFASERKIQAKKLWPLRTLLFPLNTMFYDYYNHGSSMARWSAFL